MTKYQTELVENNYGLIHGFIKLNRMKLHEYDDVLGLGLCEAAVKYDPGKGVEFSTFAYLCMRKAMQDEYRSNKNQQKAKERLAGYDMHKNCTIDYTECETEELLNKMPHNEGRIMNIMMNGNSKDALNKRNTKQYWAKKAKKTAREIYRESYSF